MKSFGEEREKKVNLMKKGLITMGILLVILIIAFIILKVLDTNREKITVNGREISSAKLIYNFGEDTYINIREMTNEFSSLRLSSFKYNSGEYLPNGSVNQDPNYMHLKSPYEVIQLKKDSDIMVKYTLISENYYRFDAQGRRILTQQEQRDGKAQEIEIQEIDNKKRSSEEFQLTAEIKEINGNEFIAIQDVKHIFNLQYNKIGNSINLSTVENLEVRYANALNAAGLQLNPNYQNRRSIIDGYFIATSNYENPSYGVYVYQNGGFRSQISESYKDVRYVQDNNNLFVIDNQGDFGLINIDTATDVIQPGLYESIESYLPDKDLYLVTDIENKKGLIDSSKGKAEPVVHIEYEEIGFNVDKFPGEPTGKIFFNSLIPARKGLRWYIFDLENPGRIFGQNTGGYLDLGYKKPEIITIDNKNMAKFTENQIEELEYKGFQELTKFSSSSTPEENLEKLRVLAREGYVTSTSQIPEGESLLIVPDTTGYGGLIVKELHANGRYIYRVISSSISSRASNQPYSVSGSYLRIYKISEDGNVKFYATDLDGYTKYELKKTTPDTNTDTNQNNDENIVKPNTENESQNQNSNDNNNENNHNNNQNTDINNSN